MGRGRNRKPRNFATFRLCPRPGAADASDRVFVRVDSNPYSVPGFADDGGGGGGGGGPSSSAAAGGEGGTSSSSADEGTGDDLPERVRQEIMALGLPDDGYDYLAHLRELRPSLSSTGGGGSSAVFLPSRRRPGRSGLPVDVKAYDLSCVPIGSGEAATAARRVEEAIDLDVVRLLEGSDLPAVESGDEDLEEDFVLVASQPEEEQPIEDEGKNFGVVDGAEDDELEVGRGKDGAQQLPREHFDSFALEEHAAGEDGCCLQGIDHGEDYGADEKRTAPQYFVHRTLESSLKEHIGASSGAVFENAGYAERYEPGEEERVVLFREASERSAVGYCSTASSGSYINLHHGKDLVSESGKKKLPKFSPGETSMKKAIIRKGIENLPTE
ncbi:hypothetical protein ACP4OV_028439 [Aristida adscensionis]